MYTVTVSVGKHIVLWFSHCIRQKISHGVLSTQSLFQEVSILCCVWYTVTISGGISWCVMFTKALYQEINILCHVWYSVTISGGKYLNAVLCLQTLYQEVTISFCVMYTVSISHCLIHRKFESHAVLCTVTIIRRYISRCVIYTVTNPVGKYLSCCYTHSNSIRKSVSHAVMYRHWNRKYVTLYSTGSTMEVTISHFTKF